METDEEEVCVCIREAEGWGRRGLLEKGPESLGGDDLEGHPSGGGCDGVAVVVGMWGSHVKCARFVVPR